MGTFTLKRLKTKQDKKIIFIRPVGLNSFYARRSIIFRCLAVLYINNTFRPLVISSFIYSNDTVLWYGGLFSVMSNPDF